MSPTLNRSERRKVAVGGDYFKYQDFLWKNRLVHGRDAIWATRKEHLLGLELKPEDVIRLGPISSDLETILQTRFR